MNKLFTKIGVAFAGIAMAIGVGVAVGQSPRAVERVDAADVAYKTIDFASDSTEYSSLPNNYTSSFNATLNGFTMACQYVNPGSSTNGVQEWHHVRIGEKKNSKTATFTTNAAIDKAITKVDVTFTGYSSKVTSTKLIMASNSTFTTDKVEMTLSDGGVGTKTFTIASPAASRYYQLAIAYDSGASSNGETRVESIVFKQHVDETQTINGSASYSSSIREDGSIELTTNATTANWSITAGSTYASLSANSGKSVTLSGSNNGAGSVTIKAQSNGYTDATATITITAKPAGTYYDITFNGGEYLSLPDGAITNVISGSNIMWQLETTSKHKFPVKNTITFTGECDSWDYADGLLEIDNVKGNISITMAAADASISTLVLSGYKDSFDIGEPFSSEGLVVNGVYDDDVNPHTSEELSSSLYDVDSSDFDNTAADNYFVVVSLKSDSTVSEMYEVTVSDMALAGTYNITSKATVYDGAVTVDTFKTKTNNSSIFTVELNKVRLYCSPGSGDVGTTSDIVLSASDAYLTLSVHPNYLITRVETNVSTKGNSVGTVTVGNTSASDIVNSAKTLITAHPFTSSVTISTTHWIYLEYINVIVTKKADTSSMASAYGKAFNDLTHTECAALAGISDATWTKVNSIYTTATAANAGLANALKEGTANKGGDDLGQCLYRYDMIVAKYEKTNFMSRSAQSTGGAIAFINNDSATDATAFIVVIAAVSTLAIGGFFFLRKRKIG